MSDGEERPTAPTGELVITPNVSWVYAADPLQLMFHARDLHHDHCDAAIVDSNSANFNQVFLVVKKKVKSKAVLRWSASDSVSDDASDELLKQTQRCQLPSNLTAGIPQGTTQPDASDTTQREMSSAIASLLSQVKTDNLFVIVQGNRDDDIYFDISALDNVDSKFTIHEDTALQNREQIHDVFRDVAKLRSDYTVHLFICEKACVNTLLTEIYIFDQQERTAFCHFSKWLIIGGEEVKSATKNAAVKLNNVAFASVSKRNSKSSCKALQNVVEASINQLMCQHVPIEKSQKTFGSLFNRLSQGNHRWSVNIVVETLLFKKNGRQYSHIGTMSAAKRNKALSADTVFPNAKFGFNNRKLLTAVIVGPIFTLKNIENGKAVYSGYCVDLLKELSRILNFSYEIMEPPDGQWGMLTENNTWTGLVGLLHQRRADLVVAGLTIGSKRDEAMDFTYPYFDTYITGLMKKPDPSAQKWKTYLYPFQNDVYILFSISFVIVCVLFYILQKCNIVLRRTGTGTYTADFFQIVLKMFAATLAQGTSTSPESLSERTFMSMFRIFCIIIGALYTGNLIAYLTVNKPIPPFTTVEELINQNDYKWGIRNGTIGVTLFRESKDPEFQGIWNGVQNYVKDDASVLSSSLTEHIQKVLDGNYLFLADEVTLEQFLADHPELELLKEKFYPSQYGVGLQDNSPFKTIFSESIMTILESGLPKVWKKKWFPKQKIANTTTEKNGGKIRIIDIQSAFYIIAIGIVMSTLFLMVEIIVARNCRRH